MIDFLANNHAKAQAWADVEGIPVSQVVSFINALTSVLLRGDTRVTNHGFKNGRPTEFQAVLQAGTAVLVDQFGVPRARCACGNPLTPPVAAPTTPSYQGTPWSGFSPTTVIVVQPSTTVINIITIIDVTNGTPFRRPTGPQAGPDQPWPGTTTTSRPPPTLPPATTTSRPPATFPPATTTTRPPATTAPSTGVYRLMDVTHTVSELANSWTVDDRAGTARIAISGASGDYRWTVPQQIDTAGSRIEWSCTPSGNYACSIGPSGEGIKFDTADLAADSRAPVTKTANVTVTAGVAEAKLIYRMGFSVTAIYTYRP